MGSHSLPVMNVHSLYADPATSMKEGRVIKLALNAKPDTNASKVKGFYNFLVDSVSFLLLCVFSSQTPLYLVMIPLIAHLKHQVVPELKGMKRKMTLMIWRMSLISEAITVGILIRLQRLCSLLT